MSVWVTVGIHGLCDEVSIELSLVAIFESDHIFTGVKNSAVISKSNGIAIMVSFAGCDSSPLEDATPWKIDLGSDIVVGSLRTHFEVRVCLKFHVSEVWVKGKGFHVIMVRGHVLGREVNCPGGSAKDHGDGCHKIIAKGLVNRTLKFLVCQVSEGGTANILTI